MKTTVDLFTRIFSVLAAPNMTVSQWADKYRRCPRNHQQSRGDGASKAPYQREIMDAVCDMRVQKVVIMSAAQIGKTDALIIKSYRLLYALRPVTDYGYATNYSDGGNIQQRPSFTYVARYPGSARQGERQSRNSGNLILQKSFRAVM